MAYDTGVRQYLAGKGVNPSSIGYVNGAITLNGQSFMKPAKNYAGTTYDSKQNLDTAWNTYNSGNQPGANPFGNATGPGKFGIKPTGSPSGIAPTGVAGTGTLPTGSVPAAGVTSTGTAGGAAAPAGTTAPTTGAAPYSSDDVQSAINALINYQPSTIDPYSTDAYKAYQAQGDRQAHDGIRAAQESMGASGFARSTNLGDRAQHIQNDETEYLNTQVIPQIMAQEQAKQAQEYQNKVAMVNMLMQKQNQDQQYGIQKSQATGYLITPEMQALYDEVAKDKQDWANATTQEGKAAAHADADAARAKLAGMNADPSLVGSDVTLSQAQANQGKYGVKTAAEIQAEWDRNHTDARDKVADKQWQDTFDLSSQETMANLTGFLPDGTPTNAKQQQDLENLWTEAANTGKIPDQLADLYGIPHGTPTQAAYQFAKNYDRGVLESDRNYGLAQDGNDLAWINAANKQSDTGDTTPKYQGFTSNQVLDAVKGQLFDQYGDPKDGSKSVDPKAIYDAVVAYGLPDGQDDQVMLALGMTKDQIAAQDKAYGAGK